MNGRMDMAFHEKKTPAGGAVDARRTAEIKSRMQDEKLTCAAAMAAAETLGAGPLDVGRAADALGLRLTVCQLGLFGFPGGAKGWTGAKAADLPVPPGFEEAVLAAGTAAGKIACLSLWILAARFSVPRIQAGFIADRSGLAIGECQLGAF